METFGKMIATARITRSLTLQDVAQHILKTDGEPITLSYLCDLEHDRRHPSPSLLPQFAAVLFIPEDALYIALGFIPPNVRKLVTEANNQQVFGAFRVASRFLVSADARDTLFKSLGD